MGFFYEVTGVIVLIVVNLAFVIPINSNLPNFNEFNNYVYRLSTF